MSSRAKPSEAEGSSRVTVKLAPRDPSRLRQTTAQQAAALGMTLLAVALLVLLVTPASVCAQESLGEKIKKAFSTPTPTPHKRKKVAAKESPSPSASPKKQKISPTPAEDEESPAPSPRKKKSSASKSVKDKSPSPSASSKKKPSPSPKPSETPSPTPSATPEETPSPEKSPLEKKRGAPNASLATDALSGFDNYPGKVQQLLSSALELTRRNLDYKYGSADPSDGGMDCSGFVYYVLKQNGLEDVPRDSSGQYVWLRRANKVEPVVSRKDDTFELDGLKPGDLLFWTGTYSIERDPPITHAMIYLGREKKSGNRVMVGASDGRTYDGQQRYGVSVFDFKMPRVEKGDTTDGKMHPTFVGYGHIPGLRD